MAKQGQLLPGLSVSHVGASRSGPAVTWGSDEGTTQVPATQLRWGSDQPFPMLVIVILGREPTNGIS